MAAISGTAGKVTTGSDVEVLNMTDWTIDMKGTSVDTSAFGGDGWGSKTGTIKNWTGKCSGNYDPADTTGQTVLNNALATTVTLKFYTDDTHYWGGSGTIVGVSMKSSAVGIVTVDYSFDGVGAVTYT
jgi:hypothetical protein